MVSVHPSHSKIPQGCSFLLTKSASLPRARSAPLPAAPCPFWGGPSLAASTDHSGTVTAGATAKAEPTH